VVHTPLEAARKLPLRSADSDEELLSNEPANDGDIIHALETNAQNQPEKSPEWQRLFKRMRDIHAGRITSLNATFEDYKVIAEYATTKREALTQAIMRIHQLNDEDHHATTLLHTLRSLFFRVERSLIAGGNSDDLSQSSANDQNYRERTELIKELEKHLQKDRLFEN
jgi:hypothetical protein